MPLSKEEGVGLYGKYLRREFTSEALYIITPLDKNYMSQISKNTSTTKKKVTFNFQRSSR